MTEEWSCGHTATSVCAECHRLLTLRANELAAENIKLIAENLDLKGARAGDQQRLFHYERIIEEHELRYFGEIPL